MLRWVFPMVITRVRLLGSEGRGLPHVCAPATRTALWSSVANAKESMQAAAALPRALAHGCAGCHRCACCAVLCRCTPSPGPDRGLASVLCVPPAVPCCAVPCRPVPRPPVRYFEAWEAFASMERAQRHLKEARAVYKRGYGRRLEEGGQVLLCQAWLRFEREEGR